MQALPPKPIWGNSSPMPRLEISRPDPKERATAMMPSLSPVGLVEHYLQLLMGPDPAAARAYISPDLVIRFTGGRVMHDPTECAAFNKQRYAWVKKRFAQTDLVADTGDGSYIVYNIGTLYGAWPDGTLFEGNRYVDRYVLRDGLIIAMDVWNDSAEWLLEPALILRTGDKP
jgi:hypothetical protein